MKELADPSATSVSMFGARWRRERKPLVKNLWFMTMITAERMSWTSPIATWLPSKNCGRGQSHIMCPIEKYMSGTRNTMEETSRFARTGVSMSLSASSSEAFPTFRPPDFTLALYPASVTALIIASSLALPSTPIEFVRRLTEQLSTPATPATAFSTLAPSTPRTSFP